MKHSVSEQQNTRSVTKLPLPDFQAILKNPEQNSVESTIKENLKTYNKLLDQSDNYSWATWEQFAQMEQKLRTAWSPISHLNNVCEAQNIRKIHKQLIPQLAQYSSTLYQDKRLYDFYQTLKDASQSQQTGLDQVVRHNLQGLQLAGVHLPKSKRKKMRAYQEKLTILQAQFAENVQDATDQWNYLIKDRAELDGLPQSTITMMRELTSKKKRTGWEVSLQYPCYSAIMRYATSAKLRERVYRAYITRASSLGMDPKLNNSSIMRKILHLRAKQAKLLGFKNYAALAMTDRSEKNPKKINAFINKLIKKSKPIAQNEFNTLKKFAKEILKMPSLQPWDLTYVSEKYKKHNFAIDQEVLRAYFPLPVVLEGLFTLLEKLFGLVLVRNTKVNIWHKDVCYYEVYDKHKQLRGGIYLDLYARSGKRGGAWMDECTIREKIRSTLTLPAAYLVCNFSAPTKAAPSLLTQDEVLTLLHECGHCLHHILTLQQHADISGINGTPLDGVEFPSQLMENFFWEKKVIRLISRHYKTGNKIGDALYKKIIKAKNFQVGMQLLRQLEFSLLDLRLHEYGVNEAPKVNRLMKKIRKKISVAPTLPEDRFANSFGHIFSGMYAAGYYSYKWAEVISADAYQTFADAGVFSQKVGESFMSHILEAGASKESLELFMAFRGRKPKIDFLLQSHGIK